MYKGITPTFTLTLPEDIDLSFASHIYVTLGRKGKAILQKTEEDLGIDANIVSVFLNQEETTALPVGEVQIQINWTYQEAGITKRACSEIASTYWKGNLEPGVLE